MKTFLIWAFTGWSLLAYSQTDAIQLLKPSGKHPVGKMIYEWTFPGSTDTSNDLENTSRTLVVHLWYPAHISTQNEPAPYAPYSKDYSKVSTNSHISPAFHQEIDRSNLILIAPGRGTQAILYSTIAEDLASHGFTVAAIDMPEIGYTVYLDGTIIKPSVAYKPPPGMMAGPYEKVDQFFEKPTALGNQDLKFVMEKLSQLNGMDAETVLSGKLNLQQIGIIGHSLGGRIAGKFTSENEIVKAYLAMEGIPPRQVRYQGKIDAPAAMLCSSGTWPYAQENYYSFIDNRKQKVYMLELRDFGHNSIGDSPYLNPDSYNYTIDPTVGLITIRSIVSAFFQSELQDKKTFEHTLGDLENVKITLYE